MLTPDTEVLFLNKPVLHGFLLLLYIPPAFHCGFVWGGVGLAMMIAGTAYASCAVCTGKHVCQLGWGNCLYSNWDVIIIFCSAFCVLYVLIVEQMKVAVASYCCYTRPSSMSQLTLCECYVVCKWGYVESGLKDIVYHLPCSCYIMPVLYCYHSEALNRYSLTTVVGWIFLFSAFLLNVFGFSLDFPAPWIMALPTVWLWWEFRFLKHKETPKMAVKLRSF